MTFTSLLGFQNDSTAWIRALALLPHIYQAQLEPDAHLWNAIIGDVSASGHWRLSFLNAVAPCLGGVLWDGSSPGVTCLCFDEQVTSIDMMEDSQQICF